MKPIAYVSDEMYVAIPGVDAEFESLDGRTHVLLRSSAKGAFYADLPPGEYKVALSRDGYGPKTAHAVLGAEPWQFRLMSYKLTGYMWPKWVRSGERSQTRVHSREQYQLSLWRYGRVKEFVRQLAWVDEHGPFANMQVLPDGDFTQTGVRWNTVGYQAPPVWVTAPERSGLYYLWARTPSGDAFSFPWVVAPAEPKAKIAVLASTNTWNAYNNFGGRSNYVSGARLPERPVVTSRQEVDRYTVPGGFNVWRPKDEEFSPLSFDRPEPYNHILDEDPHETVKGRVQCGQAPGEWRLYAWLEEQGHAYDLYAEAQLHDGTLPLDSYRVVMLAIHPEYWTRQMYFALKKWVFERGGRLMYLAGNGLNCEVVFDDDRMRCLSHCNSLHGELGGHSDDGTIEYESRMHRTLESEANLLGVVCTAPGLMTAAPYRVIDDSHWIFEGTGLQNGDLFGEHTLHERVPGGASGHETDKMSPSSPKNTVLLAKGINADEGGSDITYFDTPSGGAVFSVGSITWIPGMFPDERVSRITSNVLERFLRS
ncbi:MAG: DUF6605 domain-containing protein [Bryobacteraceae bacterium]